MKSRFALALCLVLAWLPARADINIGVILSLAGPAASLGIPEKNALTLVPKQVGGEMVNLIIPDDASDHTTAVQNAKKLIGANNVDLILGTSTTGADALGTNAVDAVTLCRIRMAGSAR